MMLAMSLVLLSCVKEAGRDMVKGPAMAFSAADPQTKAFIDDINRSGNELVVYDYMTGVGNILEVPAENRWYIDHSRIHCTVDGQEVWDYVSGDEYFWLYGSNHSCFGWLSPVHRDIIRLLFSVNIRSLTRRLSSYRCLRTSLPTLLRCMTSFIRT